MAQVNPIRAQRFLSGMDYPASKEEIVRHAEAQGADDDILSVLRQILNRQYDGPNVVSREISEAQ